MNEYNNLIRKLEEGLPSIYHSIAGIAKEILCVKNTVSNQEYRYLLCLFHKSLENKGMKNILDTRIDYIIRIIEGGEMLYEEMTKVYTLCINSYVLKKIGCETNRDLIHFYSMLEFARKKYPSSFKDIEVRFYPEFTKEFDWKSHFLGGV